MDIKQIINEFLSLESTTHKDNTYNVISLFDMLHKLGASKERYPMFFIATNDAPNNIPNTIRELLSVEYDMECTINEVSGNSILDCHMHSISAHYISVHQKFINKQQPC